MSLQRTNPEINLWPYSTAARTALTFNVQIPPWNDIRVRHALQMALDLETINATYFQGWADPRPGGRQGIGLIGYRFPYEEWPEEIKQYYRYDPEGAEKLLDEAGYPRGADGIRFKTLYEHYEAADLDYYLNPAIR
ncbi:MAG: ABC transporter substrate-binding protein [Nitrospinaceae bacterium]|nr:ABC transporter substrate-binding protein [Nitrospinaceae bacterium]